MIDDPTGGGGDPFARMEDRLRAEGVVLPADESGGVSGDNLPVVPDVVLPRAGARLGAPFLREVLECVRWAGLYQRAGRPVMVDHRHRRAAAMRPHDFRVWVEDYMRPIRVEKKVAQNEVIEVVKPTMLTQDQALICLESTEFVSGLPELDRVNPVPLPVMRDGRVVLLDPGYDKGTKSYTLPFDFPRDWSREDAVAYLEDLHMDFQWGERADAADAGRSFAAHLCAMLSGFCAGLLPTLSRPPCFAYVANTEGAGKTLLCSIALAPLFGAPSMRSLPRDPDELANVLDGFAQEGAPYVLFDNVKYRLESDKLEQFITSSYHEGRVFRTKDSFRALNVTAVFLTGNGMELGGDMARRSILVKLFDPDADGGVGRSLARVLDAAWLTDKGNRKDMLAAMWALVRSWDEAGQPKPCTRGMRSFERWRDVIPQIVMAAGFADPLQRPMVEDSGDVDGRDMRKMLGLLVVEMQAAGQQQRAWEFSDLIEETCWKHGLFEGKVGGDEAELKELRKGRASLGAYFKKMSGKRFRLSLEGVDSEVDWTLEGAGHGRRYVVALR